MQWTKEKKTHKDKQCLQNTTQKTKDQEM